jgi:3-phenylpropionate/trans-cinnamate dioxygenase ferredoxin reductase subunit
VREGLYACGDAAGGPGHWTSAAADGVAAARRILGLDPLPEQPPFFWSDQFGLRLQLVGDPRPATEVELDGSEDSFTARYVTPDGRLLAALTANRSADIAAFRRELAFVA